jgi:MFS family permease
LALLGLALFAIGGMAPAFFNESFNTVLLFRAIFGIGLGIISPLGNALIMGFFEGQKRANMLGAGSFAMNIGGIVLQFLGGAFSGISWELCFAAHFPAIISFIIVLFFLKEPEAAKGQEVDGKAVKKEKMPLSVYVISIVFGITIMLIYPMLVNMSSILSEVKQIGDSTGSAIVLSMYTVGGAISGILFGKLYEKIQRLIIPFMFVGGALGIAIILLGNSLLMVTIGVFIVGLTYLMNMPFTAMLLGMYASPSQSAMAMSILMAVMNAFAFISTYWIGLIGSITGDIYLGPLYATLIGFIAIGVLFIFINPYPKEKAVGQ